MSNDFTPAPGAVGAAALGVEGEGAELNEAGWGIKPGPQETPTSHTPFSRPPPFPAFVFSVVTPRRNVAPRPDKS